MQCAEFVDLVLVFAANLHLFTSGRLLFLGELSAVSPSLHMPNQSGALYLPYVAAWWAGARIQFGWAEQTNLCEWLDCN